MTLLQALKLLELWSQEQMITGYSNQLDALAQAIERGHAAWDMIEAYNTIQDPKRRIGRPG